VFGSTKIKLILRHISSLRDALEWWLKFCYRYFVPLGQKVVERLTMWFNSIGWKYVEKIIIVQKGN